MTIEEMQAWLERIEGDPGSSALLTSLKLCRTSPENERHIKLFAAALQPTDMNVFVLAFGHYLAATSIDLLIQSGVPQLADAVNQKLVQ